MTLEGLEAISPAERSERLLPLEALLQSWPRLTLEAPLAAQFRQGRTIPGDSAGGCIAVFVEYAKFLGAWLADVGGGLQPGVVALAYLRRFSVSKQLTEELVSGETARLCA